MLGGFDLSTMVLMIPGLVIALVFHEYAHAKVADLYGDPTPRLAGRLTIDPMAHLDLWGTLAFLLFRFGWAKPVPVDPRRFRDRFWGQIWVFSAGVLMNILLAIALTAIAVGSRRAGVSGGAWNYVLVALALAGQLNMYLAAFNILPLPPLDGWRVLSTLAPRWAAGPGATLEAFAPLILLLLLFTGIIRIIIGPVLFLINLIVSSAVSSILSLVF